MEMVLVKSGFFKKGLYGDGRDYMRGPEPYVEFTYDLYISKYQTTFDEYDAFCEATGRSKPEDERWGRGQRPVINVNWFDAMAYCNWLSEKEGLPKAFDDKGNLLDEGGNITTDMMKVVGYRLPTEAEWEYAAKGGSMETLHTFKFVGSDNANSVAWYTKNSGGMTHEVGLKAPNKLGLYDMSGNVSEMCLDYEKPTSSSAQVNPYRGLRPFISTRGGSYYHSEDWLRPAEQAIDHHTNRHSMIGFRICRTGTTYPELFKKLRKGKK